MSSERRRDFICLGIIVFAWLALWAPRLLGPLELRWDASIYYILGTAVAEGKGYRLLNEPGEIHAVQYPPLLPLIVAAHEQLMGTADYFKVGSALRLTYFVLSGLFLVLSYSVARRLLMPLYACVVGIVTALSYFSFLAPSNVLYAEIPFGVVSMLFLLCYRRNPHPSLTVLNGSLAAAAYLLRTAGLALLVSWVVESLIRRRFLEAGIRAFICAIPVVFWQIHIARVTASEEYRHPSYPYQRADYYYPNVTYAENSRLIDPFQPELGRVQFRDLSKRWMQNVAAVPVALGESAVVPRWFAPILLRQLKQILRVPLSSDWARVVSDALGSGLFAIGILALAGAVLIAASKRWFFSLYFGFNVVMIVATPWRSQFSRYLAPIVPLTAIFFLFALFVVRDWLKQRDFRWNNRAGGFALIIPLAIILLLQIAFVTHLFRALSPVSYYDAAGRERVFKLIEYGNEWHALDPAFEWIRRNAAPAAVIATTVPHLAYLRTERKAVLPPFEADPDIASRLLDQVPVSYLVIDRFGRPGVSERYAAPLVAQRPQSWRLVFSAPDGQTRVYERSR